VTIPREPLSFPNATTRIAAVLGYGAMAGIAGRSERQVRKWSHPELADCPTIAQALALDAAHIAAGGQGSPFLETFAQLLNQEVGRQIACRVALTEEIGEVAKEVGDFVAAALALASPTAGSREAHRAMGEFEEASSAMAVAGRRLSSFLPSGAGPGAENLGGAQ
jgi:hypothetical protein